MFNYEMSVKSQQSKTTKRTIYFLLVTILYKLFYMYNNIVGQPVLFFSVLFCFVLELNRATFDINKERNSCGQERMMGRGND